MRLTLRTILAYLDDVLEPNEAREIGAKIGQSQEAGQLINHIQEVIRRRRFGAPELSGPGSGPDPNIVCDYLENSLPPGQVVEFEQLCRQSDIHLAEVAACHKILTMVMGQPVDVADELRERMHALGMQKSELADSLSSENTEPMTVGLGRDHPLDNQDGLPQYLRPTSSGNRIWSVVVVLLVVGAWVLLVISDKSIWESAGPGRVAVNDSSADSEIEAPDESAADEQPAAAKVAPESSGQVAESPGQSSQADEKPRQRISANPPPPPENVAAADAIPQPGVNVPVAVADAGQPVAEEPMPADAADAQEPAAEEPVAAITPMKIITEDGLHVSRVPGERVWRVKNQGTIDPGEMFAVPEPYVGTLAIGDDLELEVRSHSRFERLESRDQFAAILKLDRGRFVISRPAVSIEKVTIGIVVDSSLWSLSFPDPQASVAIEVIQPLPDGFPPPVARPRLRGGLGVLAGKIELKVQDGEPVEINGKTGWLSTTQLAGPIADVRGGSFPLEFLTEADETRAMKQVALAYQREFGADVFRSILPVINDSRIRISELATRTVALIGEPRELVASLQSEHAETRVVAINEIRQWLAADPQNAVAFREEANRHFQGEVVDILETMLWGYSEQDGRSVDVSNQLVEQLGDMELAIRELAFYHISRLSGRTYDYHAQLQPLERRAAINRWKDYLEKYETLIPAE